jgi:outer membrane protein OmpA-like peptidoglycan-associated protein
MKSKALWVGLLAVGVADWLLVNAVVGPAYLASAEKPAMAATPERAAMAATLPGSPPVPGGPEAAANPPTGSPPVPGGPEAVPAATNPPTGSPPVPGGPEAAANPPTGSPPVPGGPEAAANPPTGSPPIPGGPEAVPAAAKIHDVAAATTTPLPPTKPLRFTRQSAELSADARRSLKNVSKYLLGNPDATLVIEGHADKRGKDEFNEWLSLQRARAVRDYLHGLGVRTKQMRVEARGSNQPIDTSGSEAARAKNRRVELIVK